MSHLPGSRDLAACRGCDRSRWRAVTAANTRPGKERIAPCGCAITAARPVTMRDESAVRLPADLGSGRGSGTGLDPGLVNGSAARTKARCRDGARAIGRRRAARQARLLARLVSAPRASGAAV